MFEGNSNSKLMDQVITVCEELDSCRLIDEEDKAKLLNSLAARFGFDMKHARWWTAGGAAISLVETDNVDWSSFGKNLQKSILEENIYFVVADDLTPRDWQVVELKTSYLSDFLDAFEWDFQYMIFPPLMNWLLDETNEGLVSIYGDFDPEFVIDFDKEYSSVNTIH